MSFIQESKSKLEKNIQNSLPSFQEILADLLVQLDLELPV